MNRKPWAIALSSVLLLIGCSLVKPGTGPEAGGPLAGLGGGLGAEQLGELLAPSRNALKVAIASRPVDEPSLGEAVWSVADEHVIDADRRRALEANGLRLGVVGGELPPEVQAVLDPEAKPGQRVEPAVFAMPDGDSAPIMLGPDSPAPQVTIFMSRKDGGAVGKDYEHARGVVRVTATQDDRGGVVLRMVPEIHSGPVQRRFAAAENGAPFEPEQFVYRDGQQEDSLRDLSARVPLGAGQVLVLGCWPERSGSLGHFLLTEVEPKSDRLLQRVVFIWATPAAGNSIPWVEPIAPPSHLSPVDPSEMGLGPTAGSGKGQSRE